MTEMIKVRSRVTNTVEMCLGRAESGRHILSVRSVLCIATKCSENLTTPFHVTFQAKQNVAFANNSGALFRSRESP